MAELRRGRSISQSLLLELLAAQLEQWQRSRAASVAPDAARPCDVVDVGGGTGVVASALATLGHRVTVIDPSPDALASLERRTAEAGLTARLRGMQGDASDLGQILGRAAADVVVCHRVLDVLDAPAEALAAMAGVLRVGGVLSLVVPQRHAIVLSQALAGHVAQARRTYARRDLFDHDRTVGLVAAAGFTVLASHGLGAVADHVPEAVVEAEAGAYEELWDLEREIAEDPAFRALAPLVHLFARLDPPSPAP